MRKVEQAQVSQTDTEKRITAGDLSPPGKETNMKDGEAGEKPASSVDEKLQEGQEEGIIGSEGAKEPPNGKWIPVNESMSDVSRAYQKQITGKEGMAYLLNGVKFDGIINGILVEVKARYNNFVNKTTGVFYGWFTGKNSLIDQANRQLEAAEGAPIYWYFAELESMNATIKLFKRERIKGIKFIYKPLE